MEFFSDEYYEHPFIFGVPDRIREDAKAWYKNYIELMDFTKNPKYGKSKCRDCLLNPNYEGSYFDLYKFIANALEITDANTLSTYPCKIVNFYSCPYDNKDQATVTRDNLFKLNQIVEITGRTLSKALDIKGTRIIYKIDFQSGKVQEIDTFLCGNLHTENLPGGKPIDHKLDVLESIEKVSLIPMNNLDDIFEILTNEEKLETVLQIGLDRKYLEYKDEVIQFFMSIKSNVRKQDLVVKHLLAHRVEKNRCSVCNQPANLNYGKDIWVCMNHLKNIGR